MRLHASRGHLSPKGFFGALLLVAALASPRAVADALLVPAQIQAQLLAKLQTYDRGFAARAGDVAKVLLVVKPGSTKSALSATEMKSALGRLDRIGGLPHEETVVPYEGADPLARKCRAERVAIVYVTPGLEEDLTALKSALANVNVLTAAAVPDHVPLGVTLGFEIESGKPKIAINLTQARRQGVDFPPTLLKLMKVYR